VRQINYDNYTIRVVDSGIDQVSIPRYFLNGNNFSFSFGYSYAQHRYRGGTYSWEPISRSVVFVMCETRVDSRLYLETSTCFSIDGSDSEYSSNSYMAYRYVKVGRTNPLDVEDSCQIEGMSLTSLPGNDNRPISCSDVHKELVYGFELSWLQVMCERSCGPGNSCNLDAPNHVLCYQSGISIEA
jgi:hypothetical protein